MHALRLQVRLLLVVGAGSIAGCGSSSDVGTNQTSTGAGGSSDSQGGSSSSAGGAGGPGTGGGGAAAGGQSGSPGTGGVGVGGHSGSAGGPSTGGASGAGGDPNPGAGGTGGTNAGGANTGGASTGGASTGGANGGGGSGGTALVPCPPASNAPELTCWGGSPIGPNPGCSEDPNFQGNKTIGCYVPGSDMAPASPCLDASDPLVATLLGKGCSMVSNVSGTAECRMAVDGTFGAGGNAPASPHCCYSATIEATCRARPLFLNGLLRTAAIARRGDWA